MDKKISQGVTPIEELEPQTDLTVTDVMKVEEYTQKGMPGLASLTEAQLTRVMDLYLSGKTYTQISSVLNIKRVTVMYLSHKFDWFAVRRDFMREMDGSIKARLMEEKIRNQDFLLSLTQFFQEKIGKQVNKYLKTGNEEDSNLSMKDLEKFFKAVELLNKFETSPRKPGDSAAVGLNVGDGVNIKKISENEVEITPKAQVAASMLKRLADSRRGIPVNQEAEVIQTSERENKTDETK